MTIVGLAWFVIVQRRPEVTAEEAVSEPEGPAADEPQGPSDGDQEAESATQPAASASASDVKGPITS